MHSTSSPLWARSARLTPVCSLSSGAEPRAVLPKKEKLKLRRERWLQSKSVSSPCAPVPMAPIPAQVADGPEPCPDPSSPSTVALGSACAGLPRQRAGDSAVVRVSRQNHPGAPAPPFPWPVYGGLVPGLRQMPHRTGCPVWSVFLLLNLRRWLAKGFPMLCNCSCYSHFSVVLLTFIFICL